MKKLKNISKSLKSVLIGYEFYRVMHPAMVGCFEKGISGTIRAVKVLLFCFLLQDVWEDIDGHFELIEAWHLIVPIGFMLYALCLDCLKNRLSLESKLSLGFYAVGCLGLRIFDAHWTAFTVTLCLSALLFVSDMVDDGISARENLHKIIRLFRR